MNVDMQFFSCLICFFVRKSVRAVLPSAASHSLFRLSPISTNTSSIRVFLRAMIFQSLAIGIEIILLAVVDGYRYVRISAKVFLQDIIVMGIERLAVHDGLQVFTDVIADDDKHVCRVVLRILGRISMVCRTGYWVFSVVSRTSYAGFCIGVEWVLLPRIDNSGFSELPAPFFRRTVSFERYDFSLKAVAGAFILTSSSLP